MQENLGFHIGLTHFSDPCILRRDSLPVSLRTLIQALLLLKIKDSEIDLMNHEGAGPGENFKSTEYHFLKGNVGK
jgi:hypothetical protein